LPAESTPGVEAGRSQIRRALAELEIEWSPGGWTKTGLAARFFRSAHRELARGLSRAQIETLAEANEYLERIYLPLWSSRCARPAVLRDLHRHLLAGHDLDSILSEVETRIVSPQSTVQYCGVIYASPELERLHCGASVQIERRPGGNMYVRAAGRYLPLEVASRRKAPVAIKRRPQSKTRRGGSNRAWMQNFFKTPTPPLWRSLK
jgi:hypothetical protein